MSLSPFIIEASGFVVGLVFGSFLNVCIARLPLGESVVSPRSRCPGCRSPIAWYDNLPLLSWVLLKARCRACGASISWHYPATELLTGLWFAIAAHDIKAAFDSVPAVNLATAFIETIAFALLGSLLIGLMVTDWQTGLLPDMFTYGGIAAAFFLVCAHAIFLAPGEDQIVLNTSKQLRLRSPGSFAAQGNVFLTGPESLIFGRIAAVCGVTFLLLAIRWAYKAVRKRDGMGLGDVKMLAMITAFLGFWPAIVALFLGVLTAAVYSVVLLTQRRAGAATRIAFGSFLAVGGLTAALFGDRLVAWYALLLQ